jgi:acyl-coenzyme A synthetase/AMP-(fatty) acid ligase
MCCYFHADRDFEDGEAIPIGKPFRNREILLLTDEGKLAEPGQEGEICIRGTAVTLGYYNDPERTSKAFVQNPLNTAYPEIIYKTGDMGKLNERGELVFVSRRDYQIKHMGHRIELGEIETAALECDGVGRSACVYNDGAKEIVLFYTGMGGENSLMTQLVTRIPRYMLPAKIIKLDVMPLTDNGKLDRRFFARARQELAYGLIRL